MAIGNIGIGNTSILATLNNDRLLIIDDKELYLIGASASFVEWKQLV